MSASAVLKLQAAGFSTEQVTALAELADTQAASKADLEGVEHRLEAKIATLEHRMDVCFAKVDAEMLLLKWMMGFILAFQVAIFVKMFMP